jgi:hypothetical protein
MPLHPIEERIQHHREEALRCFFQAWWWYFQDEENDSVEYGLGLMHRHLSQMYFQQQKLKRGATA